MTTSPQPPLRPRQAILPLGYRRGTISRRSDLDLPCPTFPSYLLSDPYPNGMTAAVLPPVRATFRAVAVTVVPETVALDAEGWATLERAVERSLAVRSEKLRRQLVLFMRLIELQPLFTERGRFSRLGPEARFRVLKSLERSGILLVRRGFWGLRTLILLGYYTQPEIQVSIGYRAHVDGWSARRNTGEHVTVPLSSDEPL